MKFIDVLDNNKTNVIISSLSLHKPLFNLTLNSEFIYDLKFKSFRSFIDEILGKYTLEASIKYAKDNHTSIENASISITNLLVFNSNNQKDYNDYYVFDDNDIEFYKDKNVIVILDSTYNNSTLKSLNILKNNGINYFLYSFDEVENLNHSYKKYGNVISEVEGLAYDIMSLIDSGVDINNIYVHVLSDLYYDLISDVFSFYNIPYSFDKKTKLIENENIVKLVNYYQQNSIDINEETLNEYKNNHYIDDVIFKKIISSIKSVEKVDLELFIYFLNSMYVPQTKYKDCIHIGDELDNYFNNDDNVFIVGANQSTFPITIGFIGLHSEEELVNNNLETEKYFNNFRIEYLLSKMKSIKNLYISYSKKAYANEFSEALILDKDKSLKKIPISMNDTRYSKTRDYYIFAKGYDSLKTYGNITDNYSFYYNEQYKIIKESGLYNPRVYLNDYNSFKNIIKNNLRLSYSSIDKYYGCSYQYYLTYIHKLDNFETTYATYLGDFFHLFIQNFIGKEFDQAKLDLLYEAYREKVYNKTGFKLSAYDAYFFNKHYSKFEELLKVINEHVVKEDMLIHMEKEIVINTPVDDVNVTLTAKPDLYSIDEFELNIIDYKTGKVPKVDIDENKGLQLYIYATLIQEHYLINKKRLPSSIKLSYYKINNTPHLCSAFDLVTITEFPCTESDILKINQKLGEVIEDILSLKFIAKPDEKGIACMYCKYKDICYFRISSLKSDKGDKNDESTN